MKNWALGLVLAASAGAAVASDADLRNYESNDYSARVYYRMDFAGNARPAQSFGLRLDNERAMAAGAPSLVQASFGELGLQKLAVSGVDFRAVSLANGVAMSSFTPAQWLALGFTAVVFATVAVDATDSEDPETTGTGAN